MVVCMLLLLANLARVDVLIGISLKTRSCRLFEEDGAEEVDCRLCTNLNALVCGLHSKQSLCIHNLWSELGMASEGHLRHPLLF